MNLKLKLALSCLLASGAVIATSAQAANLLEVYERALQSDPLIREADATRLANREAKPQAWASLLPQISGSASISRSGTGTEGSIPATLAPNGILNQTYTNQTSYGATLSQTIFSWDKWKAVQVADSQVALAEIQYKVAEQDLIVRVSQRYFGVLAAQDNVDASNAAAEAAARLLEQAEKRFEVGLIAITDVQDARAERDRTAAAVISAKRALSTAQENLRNIIGGEISDLSIPNDELALKSPEPASVEKWIEASSEQNLNLISARLNSDIASDNVDRARAGHAPTLDLQGTYRESASERRVIDPSDGAVKGYTYDSDSKSVSLTLNVPIFSGGGTQSRVRQSVYQFRATRERLERVSRETESAARDNYLGVVSNISQVAALKQAYESSKTQLQATEAGYEVGTRTSVDVLTAQRNLYSVQTQYLNSRYQYINSVLALKQAAGTLNKDDIAEINSWLKPK
jgi:outer membrane protein